MLFLKNKLLTLILAVSFLLSSCEVFIGRELKLEGESKLVVEAILTNEQISQQIRLSQSHHMFNGEAPAVTDAKVRVEANGVIYDFIPDPAEPGLYKSETPFSVFSNLVYTLGIDWQGQNYSASSQLSAVAPLQVITFIEEQNSDSLSLGTFAPIYNVNQQSMYEVNIDWSHLSNSVPAKARLYFYTFNSVHISELIPPKKEKVLFPRGSIVRVKKFGLNDDFAAYLRAMAIETDWSGNFLYAEPENLPTNIYQDAYGFFSTCAVLSDTLVAE